jgi:hypothetical protein
MTNGFHPTESSSIVQETRAVPAAKAESVVVVKHDPSSVNEPRPCSSESGGAENTLEGN